MLNPTQKYRDISIALYNGQTVLAIDSAVELAGAINCEKCGYPKGVKRAAFWAIIDFICDIDPTDQLRAEADTEPDVEEHCPDVDGPCGRW